MKKYINPRIELFAELVNRNITSTRLAVSILLNEGRVEDAQFVRNLSDQNWFLGMFEGTVVADEFPIKKENVA